MALDCIEFTPDQFLNSKEKMKMCEFFSCIVMKDKKVLHKKGLNGHHEILEYFKVPDTTTDPTKIAFVKIEITPPDIPSIWGDLSIWKLTVDQAVVPDWYSPAHASAARKALSEYSMLRDYGGGLYLRGYSHRLPDGFVSCGGDLYLGGYDHKLPDGFVSCGGDLYLGGYSQRMPDGLDS